MGKGKNTYYFSHDANAHEDPKIVALMVKFGAKGYGWWWIMIEVMFQQKGYGLDTNEATTIPMLSRFFFDASVDDVEDFIEYCEEVKLITNKEGVLTSPSLLERVKKLDEIREKRVYAANVRWGKTGDKKEEEPAVEEESDEKPEDKPNGRQVLFDDKKFAEFKVELVAHKRIKIIPSDTIDNERDKCMNYIDYKKKVYKDYKAFFRNWLFKWIEDNDFKPTGGMVF